MDDQTKTSIRTALRVNEIGRDSPYELLFAGKAKSGASFGAAQGDLAAQPLARDTLRKILEANGVNAAGSPRSSASCRCRFIPIPCRNKRPCG